ncbi:hypothetical protein PF007_g29583, partial [Phytophthora fragariae]
MRAHYVLLATAVAFLASSDAASTTAVSNGASPGLLSSAVNALHTPGIASRFLRIHKGEDDDSDETKDEERGLVSLVYEGGVNFFKKMTQSAPAVNKVDDQLALLKFEDQWLAGQVGKYTDKYLAMFKQVHELGYTPKQVSKMWGLAKKSLSMNKRQLLKERTTCFGFTTRGGWLKMLPLSNSPAADQVSRTSPPGLAPNQGRSPPSGAFGWRRDAERPLR